MRTEEAECVGAELIQLRAQLTSFETAKSWLDRRLKDTEVCLLYQSLFHNQWFNYFKLIFIAICLLITIN